MFVQEVDVDSHIKYMLIDSKGQPVVPVTKYLKYLDYTDKSKNTLRSYCHHLKLYYEFLEEKHKNYNEVDLDLLAQFIGWLRNPDSSNKVVNIKPVKAKRSEKTVNVIMSCVIGFYDYLMKLEIYNSSISESVKTVLSPRFRTFRPFLHHVTKGNPIERNILKLKEPRRTILTLTKEEANQIYAACTNIRDKLLIRFLYEGGLRIGEAIALWIEDIDISRNAITVRESKTNEGKSRIVYISNDTINLFQDYLIDYHSEEVDSNFIFITLTGKNKGQPLNKEAVYSLVKRIRKKVNIDFTPHMFRHTFASELYENGTDISIIQKLLGHAQVQTTIHTYMHLSDETIRNSYEQAQKNKKKGLDDESRTNKYTSYEPSYRRNE